MGIQEVSWRRVSRKGRIVENLYSYGLSAKKRAPEGALVKLKLFRRGDRFEILHALFLQHAEYRDLPMAGFQGAWN